jgi:hypothetical protein
MNGLERRATNFLLRNKGRDDEAICIAYEYQNDVKAQVIIAKGDYLNHLKHDLKLLVEYQNSLRQFGIHREITTIISTKSEAKRREIKAAIDSILGPIFPWKAIN